jgi:Chaperone of endosialidase
MSRGILRFVTSSLALLGLFIMLQAPSVWGQGGGNNSPNPAAKPIPGTVTSITAGTGLTGGTITTSGTIAIDLAHTNNFTAAQGVVTSHAPGAAFDVENTSSTGGTYGGYFQSDSTDGVGVVGFGAPSSVGVEGIGSIGVWGISSTGGGIGVFGNGTTWAVYAQGNARVQGDLTVDGCVTYSTGPSTTIGSCLSDVRLKKNIQPFSPVLNKLVRLQPVSYNWRVEEFPEFHFGTGRNVGLVAQEVEKVFPDLVSTDAKGYRRVNYGELPYLMLQAIRELKAENDSVGREKDGQIEQLKEQVGRQQAQMLELRGEMAAFRATLEKASERAVASASH